MGVQQSAGMAEALLSAEMDRQESAVHRHVETFPLGASSAAMQQWISSYDTVTGGYRLLQGRCQLLERQGRPQARQRFDARIADYTRARAVYVQMYNDKVANERAQLGIMQNAVQFGIAQQQAANAYQQASFGTAMQGIQDATMGRCHGCHYLSPVPGYNYCYGCGRARGMWY
jgi:hypothetical protein